MKPQLKRVGNSNSPVVVVDDFSGSVDQIARLADALAPFPAVKANFFPGVRRMLGPQDKDAYAYAVATCERAAPFVGGAFGIDSFDLGEASFSVVSTPPERLQLVQRAPHFDSPDPNLFALLHYLRVPEGSGTAFYRHRSTMIERITPANVDWFVGEAKRELPKLRAGSGYIHGSNQFYEEIGRVEAVADRLVVYHGSLLHSGIIPPGMPLSPDPRTGRLTANLFIRGR